MTVEIENEKRKEKMDSIIKELDKEYEYFVFFGGKTARDNWVKFMPSIHNGFWYVEISEGKEISTLTKKPIRKSAIPDLLSSIHPLVWNEPIIPPVIKETSGGYSENPFGYVPDWLLRVRREEEQKTIEKNELVYFIQSNIGEAIKIGVSGCPEQRMNNLQTGIPFVELKLLATMKGGYKKEKELHKRFSDDRIKNEWFRSSDKLLSYIEQIKGGKE